MAPHEATRRTTRVAFFGCVFACLLGAFAPPARATHVLVEPGNLSAYQTINAALAAQSASLGAIETVYVAPGVYPETLKVREAFQWYPVLSSIGGPSLTVVYGATAQCKKLFPEGGTHAIRGFRFLERVFDLPPEAGLPGQPPVFRECVFESGVKFGLYQGMWAHLFDCTFRGDSELRQYASFGLPAFSGLRFERCGLTLTTSTGPAKFEDCTFTGCPDTAVAFAGEPENQAEFTRCTVESCAVAFANVSPGPALVLTDCAVRDVGVALRLTSPAQRHVTPWARLSRTTIERVGAAIEGTGPWDFRLDHCRLAHCSGIAFQAHASFANMTAVRIEHAAAGVLLSGVAATFSSNDVFRGFLADSCDIRNVAGDALWLHAASAAGSGRVAIRNSTFAHNGGGGIIVAARGVTVSGSVIENTGGDGIVLQQLAPAAPDSIIGNTVVLAQGRGIAIERDSGVLSSAALVASNTAVFSGQTGIAVGAFASASVQQNDAWQNALGDFSNVATPLANNLSVNPLFCGVGSGDYTLQSGSPCAPSGVYGLIGALPVACATATTGVAPRGEALALSVGPSPSLGGVRFALPSRAEAGELEVLDLAGRRVWSQQIAPHTESLEWSGRTNGVRASGVFFARVTRAGESVTQRFVLLK